MVVTEGPRLMEATSQRVLSRHHDIDESAFKGFNSKWYGNFDHVSLDKASPMVMSNVREGRDVKPYHAARGIVGEVFGQPH